MKDRITRRNVKKPSHRLFRTTIGVSFVTVFIAAALSLVLVHVSNENKTLSRQIENYNIQIDNLENNEETNSLKYISND